MKKKDTVSGLIFNKETLRELTNAPLERIHAGTNTARSDLSQNCCDPTGTG